MKPKIFIHVGLHKTGTTFLQQQVFPLVENVNFITSFNDILLKKIDNDKINIISNETLSGTYDYDRYYIADRLKLLFPDAKIILGIRDKDSWVCSCYSEFVKHGGTLTYEEYIDKRERLELRDFEGYIKYLKDLFVDVYVYDFEDFKNDITMCILKICVFMDVKPPTYDYKKINISLSDKQINRWRYLNHWFKSPYNYHGGIFPHYMNPLRLLK